MFRLAQRVFARNIAVPRRASVGFRAFSCSCVARNATSELLDVVRSEHKIAVEVENDLEPPKVEYLQRSRFQTMEKPYGSSVQLHKDLGNGEELRVFFDIDEVSDVYFPSPKLEETDAAEDKFENEIADYEASFANVKVLISRPLSNDGLFFNLLLQDSEEGFLVDYFNYKPDVSEFLAQVESSSMFLSNAEYQGPRFSNLDDALQITMEKYLNEKGIDMELAEFVFSYAEVKEEDSYRHLLDNVSKYLSH